MATRPAFIPLCEGRAFVQTSYFDFEWHPGLAPIQKQRNIDALHLEMSTHGGLSNILEISSKSRDEIGVALSAFNLSFITQTREIPLSVETAFQGSKVFERGGPFTDLYFVTAREAKRDPRLSSSGRLIGFKFFGTSWGLEPQTAFYDWLYLNTLIKNPQLAEQLLQFSAFTDIEFNPEKSINCQAYSAALYVSLSSRGLLERALSSKEEYLELMQSAAISSSRVDELRQPTLRSWSAAK